MGNISRGHSTRVSAIFSVSNNAEMPRSAKANGATAKVPVKVDKEVKDTSSDATSPQHLTSKADDAGRTHKAHTAWTWFTSKDLKLKNVGSVARDHLAVSALATDRDKQAERYLALQNEVGE